MLNVTKTEGRLSVEDVAKQTGKSVSAVREWMRPTKRVELADGRVEYAAKDFYLESAVLGGQRYTNQEELDRFQAKCSQPKRRRAIVDTKTGDQQADIWKRRLQQDYGVITKG